MSEIYNAKSSDWTCPNCGHESPTNTFEIIEQLELKLAKTKETLEKIRLDYKDNKHINFLVIETFKGIGESYE